MKKIILGLGLWIGWSGFLFADSVEAVRWKSPSGHFETTFQPLNEKTLALISPKPTTPEGQQAQYLLNFYVTGSTIPVSTDWYTDAGSPQSPTNIFPTLLWSPQEDFVVVTHGLRTNPPHPMRWIISLSNPMAYGFEGRWMQWVDRYRLISDIQTPKTPGGIQLIDTKQRKMDLLIPPREGIGYQIVSLVGHRLIIQEFLNHTDEGHAKTTWESFEPACFELDLDSMKKRSVSCAKN